MYVSKLWIVPGIFYGFYISKVSSLGISDSVLSRNTRASSPGIPNGDSSLSISEMGSFVD